MEKPPVVPPEFFDTPDFRTAFATREMGKVFRQYRTDPRHWPVYGRDGIGQSLLGSWLGLTQAQVSRIETGRIVPHDLHSLVHYARTLHLPEQLLWFDLPNSSRLSAVVLDRETSNVPKFTSNKWKFDETIRNIVDSAGSDLIETSQRLQGGVFPLAGSELTEPLQPWLAPLRKEISDSTGKSRRNYPALREHEIDFLEKELKTTYRGWKNTGSGLLVRKVVIAQLNEVVKRLREAEHGPATDRAFRLAAGLAKVAASTSYDAGLPRFAQRYYMVSVQLAKIANDDVFAAVTLADLARQSYDLGQPDDGLEIVQLAQYGTRKLRIPRLRSVLATREAWAYAQRGEKQNFYRAVGLAEDHFSEGATADAPDPIRGFDAAELAGVIGARYRDLAHHDSSVAPRAVRYIEQAVEKRDSGRGRNRVFDLIGLARTYLIMDEPDRACELIGEVIPIAEKWSNGRVGVKLKDFYRESARYVTLDRVRDVRDAINTLVTAQ